VVEGDEYDSAFFDKRPKFVHYLPNVAVVGNVEFDHADIYADLAAVQTAFVRLLQVVPRNGLVVAGTESPALREILGRACSPVRTFAVEQEADYRATGLRAEGKDTIFRLHVRGEDRGELRLGLPGAHNVRNALAALAAAEAVGVSLDQARPALASFGGVKRRLELRGRAAGVSVYDDFAHHPTAIAATLQALRSAGPGRLLVVFEPRSYTSRTRVFQDAFAEAFTGADGVIVAAAFAPAKVPADQRLSEPALVEAVNRRGGSAAFVASVPDIVARVTAEARAGDRVVVLSNGGFGGIHEKLLAALEHTGR
jgi:UDP-N-acetylmuramate: L-alanyl-gamma-D-glutamyl-meso-diaminopimelate ligase